MRVSAEHQHGASPRILSVESYMTYIAQYHAEYPRLQYNLSDVKLRRLRPCFIIVIQTLFIN